LSSIVERIDRWGRLVPERVAHVSGGRTMTYRELLRRSDALAAYLSRKLPDDGSPVALLGHKEPERLVGLLGAVKAGHPYVPLDAALPPQRIDTIVAAAGAKAVLAPEEVACLSELERGAPLRRRRLDDPFYVMFTSGSSGQPKGVVVTDRCLTAFLDGFMPEQGFVAGDETFLNVAPFSFDLSVMDTFTSLLMGGTLWSLTRDEIENPRRLYEALPSSMATTWVSTPSFARLCLAERRFGQEMMPRLCRFLFCGEILAPELVLQLFERFPRAEVWNTYGPTETTVAATSVRIPRGAVRRGQPLPIGRPLPTVRVVLLDETGRPVPPGERGEIVIAGPSVSPGYFRRPDLTELSFFALDGMPAYRTGDLGRFQGGQLYFEGRCDDQVKLRGYRVELGDVESQLRALPGVCDAVVVPVVRQGVAESLAAFVIPRNGASGAHEDAERLRAGLCERLPSYMVPLRLQLVEAFPTTANGKVDRKLLAARLA
jgi:D-alanine--poly(phosphoribitol) ligase subunit 1